MLLELFLFLEIICLAAFLVGFFRENPWFSAIAIIFSGALIFASFNIEQNVSVIANQTMIGNSVFYNNVIMTKQVNDQAYFGINLGVFLLSLVIFLYDIFSSWKEGQLKRKNG